MSRLGRRFDLLAADVVERLLEGFAGVEPRSRVTASVTLELAELAERRRRAAMRAAARALSDGDAPEPPPSTRRSRRPSTAWFGPVIRFRHAIAFAVALIAVTGGATASSLWLAPAGNPVYGFNPGLIATAPPGAQLDALGVLRRQQTASDRARGVQAALAEVNNFTTGLRSDFVRVVGTTAAGPVVLVPVKRRTYGSAVARPRPPIRDALCVYYPLQGGAESSATHCWSTAQMLAGQAVAAIGAHEFGLAPDGVVAVRVSSGTSIASVPVVNNFFDATLPTTRPGSGIPVAPRIEFVRAR